jgi:hypothetical protein
MFRTKYTVSLLNVKWEEIKRNLKMNIVPRMGEFIYLDDTYYEVISVIHSLGNIEEYFIIVDGTNNKKK